MNSIFSISLHIREIIEFYSTAPSEWKLRKFALTLKFVKITVMLKKLQKSRFHEFFFSIRVPFLFTVFHTAHWKSRNFTLTEKIFRQITDLVIYLVNMLLSRNFCWKRVRVNFRNFHTVHWAPFKKIVKTAFSISLHVDLTEFLRKIISMFYLTPLTLEVRKLVPEPNLVHYEWLLKHCFHGIFVKKL